MAQFGFGSVNEALVIGNVGGAPEIRHTASGKKVASFSVATSKSYKDRNSGERKEKTQWHRIVVWGDSLVELVEKFISKGTKVRVTGAMESREWTDQSGNERSTTEIVVTQFEGAVTVLSDNNGKKSSEKPEQKPANAPSNSGGNGWEPPADLDDEIPF
jgi:single-strand DNA-binding protein